MQALAAVQRAVDARPRQRQLSLIRWELRRWLEQRPEPLEPLDEERMERESELRRLRHLLTL
jgi:hypothetical protein